MGWRSERDTCSSSSVTRACRDAMQRTYTWCGLLRMGCCPWGAAAVGSCCCGMHVGLCTGVLCRRWTRRAAAAEQRAGGGNGSEEEDRPPLEVVQERCRWERPRANTVIRVQQLCDVPAVVQLKANKQCESSVVEPERQRAGRAQCEPNVPGAHGARGCRRELTL